MSIVHPDAHENADDVASDTDEQDAARSAAALVGLPMAEYYETTAGDYDDTEVQRAKDWVRGGHQLPAVEDFMFRLLADDLPDSVCVFAPDGRIVWANRAWLAIPGTEFGLTVEDVVGLRLEDLLVQPRHVEPLRLRWEAVQSLTPHKNLVMQTFPVSDTRTQQLLYKAWFDDAGRPVMYVGVGRDHSAAHEIELRLQNSLRQLADSNRDLQDFAYVASHDLQEPLRKIIAFTDRLRATLGDLDEKPADYLDRLENAAERMQRLIDDLLTFSRVSTRAQEWEMVDLGDVVADVLGDLEVRIAETGAVVEYTQLPTLRADPTQMGQLFLNLIGNAIKFHRPGEAPRVTIAAASQVQQGGPDGGEAKRFWQISVRDEGIGFDQKYAQKIFTVFQRLHGRNEYLGSGIGLSVCRRIAERHGGSITAGGQEGVGATFSVMLPEEPPNDETRR